MDVDLKRLSGTASATEKPRLDQFLKSENFQRVAVAENVAGQIVYRWELEAAGYSPASEVYICVYRRKL